MLKLALKRITSKQRGNCERCILLVHDGQTSHPIRKAYYTIAGYSLLPDGFTFSRVCEICAHEIEREN